MTEIDQLIQKSYEDMTKGLLSEERFATLTVSLESEQKRLKEAIPEMETRVETATDKANDLQHFIERARQVTRLTELTPEILEMAGGAGSWRGTGGMATKLLAAERAMAAGIDMIIANGANMEALYDLAEGKAAGTRFAAARKAEAGSAEESSKEGST